MDLRFQRVLRPIAAVTLVFFAWISIEPWNYAVWAQTAQTKGHRSVAPTPSKSSSGKFEESLRALKKAVEDLDKDVASGKDISLQLESLKAHKQALEAADPEIRAEFAATEKFLKEKKLPQVILNRQAKAVADYNANYKTLKDNLDAIVDLESKRKNAEAQNDQSLAQAKRNEMKAKIKAAKDHLAEKVKGPRHQKLDPNNLPNRAARPTNRKPRLKKEQFKDMVGANRNSPILLAYNGDPSEFLLAQNNQDLPTPEDLAETIEVQFTQDIQDLAAQLDHNPVKIYNWVHNNIDFVPTYGSIQGAEMCLQTRQCNDMDTASLIIALLRTSGIPARYVTGTIQVPMDQVMNWVGGFTNAQSALDFISSGGVPVSGYVSGGAYSQVQMEHTWVESYVDYVPSRGAVNKQGDTWVPMDASFKQFTFTQGIDLTTAVPFDVQSMINQVRSTATVNNTLDYVANIDSALIQTTVTDYLTSLQNYLQTNLANATLDDLIGRKTIVPHNLLVLPATLPYTMRVQGSKFSIIPANLVDKFTFSLGDPIFQETGLEYTAALPELVGKRFTLSYAPATVTDQQVINQFGGLYQTPSYLINVKPQIRVEGDLKAEGPAVGMGSDQKLVFDFSQPTLGTDKVENIITAGSYYAIGLVPDRLTSGYLAVLTQRAQDLDQFMQSGGDPDSDSGIGEKFYLTAMTYFWETDRQTDVLAARRNISYLKQPGEGIFSLVLSVANLFGIPTTVTVSGLNFDVDRVVYTPMSKNGNLSAPINFTLLAGTVGSSSEHGIMEQVFRIASISAVKAIELAVAEGQKIYHITSSNYSIILPLLQVNQDVKTDIINAVNAGKEVLIPESELNVSQWTGTGYIISDPKTGAGAYLISGGTGGVDTIEQKEAVMEIQRQVGFTALMSCFVNFGDGAVFISFASYMVAAEILLATSGLLFVVWLAILVAHFYFWFVVLDNCRDELTSPHAWRGKRKYAIG
jgi:Transglutaminase-like superfamily